MKIDLTFPDIKSIAHGFGNSDIDEENEAVKSDGITLGHLLQSVFVSAPNLSYPNIAFLDTPGYSKPNSSSYSAKTDERIARAQLNSSNYILWFVPADAGVISADDVTFLNSLYKSIPKLIIISKADKAPNAVELSDMREKVKSTLDVKGIRYEDVLLFSRRKGQEYDKEKILAYLTKLDETKQEVDFARSFKKLFVECRKFYDETLKKKERWLSRLNRALTYQGDNDDVNECLTDVSLDVKDSIKEIKLTREKLNNLQTEFFTEIKRVADCVKIKMPEPSEIDMLEDNVSNPAIVLEKLLNKHSRKANAELIVGKCKRYNAPWSYGLVAQNADLSSTDGLIKVAKIKTFNEHILKGISDNFLKRAYIVLLMSIARVNVKSTESLLYPCSIALSCGMESDIDEYMKESIMLGEKEFGDYAKVLSAKNIRDLFIFDALSMVCVHAAGDEEKFAYVAGLAALIGIGEGEISEVLLVAECLLGGKDTFECNCRYIDMMQFRDMLIVANKNIIYETSEEFVRIYTSLTDLTNKIPSHIYGKQRVLFKNVYIHDKKITIRMENCKEVRFDCCEFYNCQYPYDNGLLIFNNANNVIFTKCKFSNIGAELHPLVMVGAPKIRVLGSFDKVNNILFENVMFKDCGYWNVNFGGQKTKLRTNLYALTDIGLSSSERIFTSSTEYNYAEHYCTYNNSSHVFKSEKYS